MAQQQGGTEQHVDLVGYRVDAVDGHAGRVDRHSAYLDERHILVDTGVWVFGKEISVPMSAVADVDEDGRTVRLDLTREQLEQLYRDQTAAYFPTGS
ncbi:PRC-barrel domain containing protein [Kitasatospora sp. NPDC088346]|uniref:PRC-barrel domain containing protein n=1 Tax=Kitasatospora sp. NPDC088346 TaxID=3364073 RepID=UPI003822913E